MVTCASRSSLFKISLLLLLCFFWVGDKCALCHPTHWDLHPSIYSIKIYLKTDCTIDLWSLYLTFFETLLQLILCMSFYICQTYIFRYILFCVDFHLHTRLPSIAPWGTNKVFWIESKLKSDRDPLLVDLKLLFALLLLHGDKFNIALWILPTKHAVLYYGIVLCEFGEHIPVSVKNTHFLR